MPQKKNKIGKNVEFLSHPLEMFLVILMKNKSEL